YDPDGESVSYRYQWYKNGVAIAGATAATLDLARPGNGSIGDVLTVRVIPYDASASGLTVASAGVTVINAAVLTAAYQHLAAGYHYAYAAYVTLGTPAAYTAWVYASYAWAFAQYAYTVDSRYWGQAAFYASLAYQCSWSVYVTTGNPHAYAAYVYGYYGWLYAKAIVSNP